MKKLVRSPREVRRGPEASDWRSAAGLLIFNSWILAGIDPCARCWRSQRPDPKRVTFTKTQAKARPAPNRAESLRERETVRIRSGRAPELQTLGGRRAPRGPADSG